MHRRTTCVRREYLYRRYGDWSYTATGVQPTGEQDPSSHAEPPASDGVDGVGGSAEFDVRHTLTTEEIEQQLARKSGDANGRVPSPGHYGMGRPCPSELEPRVA